MTTTIDFGEPLAASPLTGCIIRDRAGVFVCDVVNEAWRSRIIACVNACAGIPTDALEAGVKRTFIGIREMSPVPGRDHEPKAPQ